MKLVFDSLDLQGRVQLRERILSWKDPDLYPSLSMEGSMPLGEEEQSESTQAATFSSRDWTLLNFSSRCLPP